jgi:GDSL-like Lipase/Acylhydrolase family
MEAALAVLRAHPGQVSPVTIDIGANDRFFGYSFAHIEANVSTILAKLREAAPYTEIILLGYWNPLTFPSTVPPIEKQPRGLWAQLNAMLAGVAARYRAHFVDRSQSLTRRSTRSQRSAGSPWSVRRPGIFTRAISATKSSRTSCWRHPVY